MKKAIVYVRTNFWGRWAVEDLLAQENRCLAYAQANNLKVVRIFREKASRRQTKSLLILKVLEYADNNANKVECLIVYSKQNLTRYKYDFSAMLQAFRATGIKIVFVINQKHQKYEN